MHRLVVHGHFYQPPREDPWTELIGVEPGATPDHDWNERIDRECYRPFGATEVRAADPRAVARDPDARGGIARIVNLYSWCSFDAGATLCEWLDNSSPRTLQLMREGDAASVKRLGFGNAIAAPYHHIILPLASRRDKVTEVRWGVADFRNRFGREPEGMWLPECAVDEETLEVLALEGIRFTILAPYQIRKHAPRHGGPVRWKAGGNKEIAILPYDGSLAGDVAFGNLLGSPAALAHRFRVAAEEEAAITTLATDGETFGHHHAGGNITLADALAQVRAAGTEIVNAATVIAAAYAGPESLMPYTDIVAPSSWSCAHGVERWRSDCGCKLNPGAPTSQRWRRPLRESLEALAEQCHLLYEREGALIFSQDPWEVRNRYGAVVASQGDALAELVRKELQEPDNALHLAEGRRLLELERAVMRTFTSCAWFFDDVARIEVRQVLRYAARALALSGKAARLGSELIAGLEKAQGNSPSGSTGAELYVREAVPHVDPMLNAAAGIAAMAAMAARDAHGLPGDAAVGPAASESGFASAKSDADAAVYTLGAYSGHVRMMYSNVAASDVAAAASGTRMQIRMIHERSAEQATFNATVTGSGTQLTVLINFEGSAPVALPVRELPETAARMLLAGFAASPRALD